MRMSSISGHMKKKRQRMDYNHHRITVMELKKDIWSLGETLLQATCGFSILTMYETEIHED
jgi:hypothetical protein